VADPSREKASPIGPVGRFLAVVHPPVIFPNTYTWFVFVSAMDIMLTWIILWHGGAEVNPVARAVIDRWGLNGAIAFKFALAVFVIVICEYIGRRKQQTGRRLATAAVVISAIPVAYSLLLLSAHRFAAESGG